MKRWSASSSGSRLSGDHLVWARDLPTLMNNVAWTASHPPGDKLKWKALCGHLMPTEYADYVTFVFGYVHVWCCHKFVCLCIKCVVEGQRAGTDLCGFICTTYLIRRVISSGFYVNFSHP